MSISAKVKHVRNSGQSRNHECHWPGCTKQVPPAMWGCTPHWYKLPKSIRDGIWATYRVGQEADGAPSDEYLEWARAAHDWALKHP